MLNDDNYLSDRMVIFLFELSANYNKHSQG